jgi:hypothetical protein
MAPHQGDLKERIEALTRFLPIFETPGYDFATWHKPDGEVPRCVLDPSAEEFVTELYRQDWILSPSWPDWRDEVRKYANAPEEITRADLDTVQRLISAHVRADRIKEGHLLTVFNSGHLTLLIRRLKDLGEELS